MVNADAAMYLTHNRPRRPTAAAILISSPDPRERVLERGELASPEALELPRTRLRGALHDRRCEAVPFRPRRLDFRRE
jgi:hypothetical protein